MSISHLGIEEILQHEVYRCVHTNWRTVSKTVEEMKIKRNTDTVDI